MKKNRQGFSRARRAKLLNVYAQDHGGADVYMKLMQRVMMRLSERPMSLRELAEETGIEEKQVYRVLSSLHRSRRIVHIRDEDGVRRYRPCAR